MILDAAGKPVFADVRKEVIKRFINICLHPIPAIAQKPMKKQLEDWVSAMHPDQYQDLYIHIRQLDKRKLAILAQQVIATVRAAHLAPKEPEETTEKREVIY